MRYDALGNRIVVAPPAQPPVVQKKRPAPAVVKPEGQEEESDDGPNAISKGNRTRKLWSDAGKHQNF